MIRHITYTYYKMINTVLLSSSGLLGEAIGVLSDTMSGSCVISIPADDRLSCEPLLLSTNWSHC